MNSHPEMKIENDSASDNDDVMEEMNLNPEFASLLGALMQGWEAPTSGGHGVPSVLAKAIIEGLNLRDVYPRYFATKFYENNKHYISKLAMMRAILTGHMNTMTMFGYKFSMCPEEYRFLTDNDMKAYEALVNKLIDEMAPKLGERIITRPYQPKEGGGWHAGTGLWKDWEGYDLPVDFMWERCASFRRMQIAVSLSVGSCDFIDMSGMDLFRSDPAAKGVLSEYFGHLSIKPSKMRGAGKGVFTSKAIKKGEIVGWYAGKMMNEAILKMRNIIKGSLGIYDMGAGDRWEHQGFSAEYRGIPVNDANYGGCMQMCNDAACITKLEPIQIEQYEDKAIRDKNVAPCSDKEFIEWYRNSNAPVEVKTVLKCLVTYMGYKLFIAEKDIPAGGEFKYGYGANYWMWRLLYKEHPEIWTACSRENLAEIAIVRPYVMKYQKRLFGCAKKMCGMTSNKLTAEDNMNKVRGMLLTPNLYIGLNKGWRILTTKFASKKDDEFKKYISEGAPYTNLMHNTTFFMIGHYDAPININYVKSYKKRRAVEYMTHRDKMDNLIGVFGRILQYTKAQ